MTNYSVNKNSEQFVANTDPFEDHVGSKWSITSLRDFFSVNNINGDLIFERIDDVIIKTILSTESMNFSASEMQVPFRNNCFDLFGFDVLIDANLKPWLLEVNLSPSLNIDSPLDLRIKGELVSDLFTLIGVVPLDQRYSIDTS